MFSTPNARYAEPTPSMLNQYAEDMAEITAMLAERGISARLLQFHEAVRWVGGVMQQAVEIGISRYISRMTLPHAERYSLTMRHPPGAFMLLARLVCEGTHESLPDTDNPEEVCLYNAFIEAVERRGYTDLGLTRIEAPSA